jgi:hypothetical protein
MTTFPTLLVTLALLAPSRPFAIIVADEQTGRGVPLVELQTVHNVRYVTDSAGVAAVDEPGLMGQSVFFHVKSHGYEFPKDGFGNRGKALTLIEGGSATLKLRRVNIAERLYRVTGAGVYRDSLLTGRSAPIRQPLLNAWVLGSDSVVNALYHGKLYWFWGDTNRPGYPLGNFHVPGATSDLPGAGGLDPEVGVDLTYFVAEDGFAKETAHLPGEGPTWISGLAAFHDPDGRERLVADYVKIRPPLELYEHGLAEFDPGRNRFEKVATFPLDATLRHGSHTFLGREDGVDSINFADPFPLVRVRADLAHLKDATRYEAFTCLETGSRFDPDHPKIDRDTAGRARYAWRRDTSAVGAIEQAKLVRSGALKADEALLALQDVDTGRPVVAHRGSVCWNAYRKRWVLIAVETFGEPSMLGEVWYAEADTPLGPWAYARKIVTHDKYSFYNPKQHPYFDKDGGRTIFFEGTYTVSFSGNTGPTPRYEYNQIMYKLDLSDPRLNLPVPVYERVGGGYAMGSSHAASGERVAFFALERPGVGTVPVGPKDEPVFHALPLDAKNPPKAAVALDAVVGNDFARRPDRPACLVWRNPTTVRLPVAK